jgi:hypothetical protein
MPDVLKFALLAVAVQAFLSLSVAENGFKSKPLSSRGCWRYGTEQGFCAERPLAEMTVRSTTSLSNNWIGRADPGQHKVTGAAWPTSREIAYYYGADGGESWSEGNREDEVVFIDIPAGTYYLAIDPDMPADKPVAVNDKLEVFTGGAGWSNFVLVMIFLVVFPIFTRLRHAAFEAKRWMDSDHPPVSSSDSDSDD